MAQFESRKEEVKSFTKFLFRVVRYALFAFCLILFSLLVGTFGYHWIGELEWIDSFHMTCMILTGMGPVIVIDTIKGKLFSSFYALYSGVAFLSITAVFFAPIIHRLLHILHVEEDNE
ncbi:MAG: hypothetical protein ABI851_07095 [Saprospiraceae bacterium]